MLVLTRKVNQAVHIGDNIVITVTKVRGEAVRLGIQAPSDIKVMRSELLERQGKDAAQLKLVQPNSDVASPIELELAFEINEECSTTEPELEDEPLCLA